MVLRCGIDIALFTVSATAAAARASLSIRETTATTAYATTACIRSGFFTALVEDCLFFENETVELAKRFIELAFEPGTALFRGFRTTGRSARGRCFCAGLSFGCGCGFGFGCGCGFSFCAGLSFGFTAGLGLFACRVGLVS